MNEREIINIFSSIASTNDKRLVRGIGDDCAAIQIDSERLLLVTTDTLLESIHFDLSWHPPEKLGWKTVAVNVSDIAAMGGSPTFVFLSLGLPKGFDPDWLWQFASGFNQACLEYGCCLAGGDTVQSADKVAITLTVHGEVLVDRVLYRDAARVGDEIWVSGTLGKAAAGLDLCRQKRVEDKELFPLVDSHLAPKPRIELAKILAASGKVHAMMDISDGLATDLAHICEQSGTGALIYSDMLPVHPLLIEMSSELKVDLQTWLLKGGEDYELLFTASPDNRNFFEKLGREGCRLSHIGYIDKNKGVRLMRSSVNQTNMTPIDISYLGYEHFKE